MDFYYLDLSAPCRSVMLTAKALGVTLNKKPLNLLKKEQLSPEYISINPQHCVPTIVDGDFVLWESRAICTYLVAQYGKDDSLYPKDPKTRALIDRLLYFDMGTLYNKFRDYIYPVMFAGEKPCPEKLALVHESLGLLDGFLEGASFSVGDHITVADFALIASVSTMLAAEIDISKYPNIHKWFERCKTQMIGYDSENEAGVKKYEEFVKSKLRA